MFTLILALTGMSGMAFAEEEGYEPPAREPGAEEPAAPDPDAEEPAVEPPLVEIEIEPEIITPAEDSVAEIEPMLIPGYPSYIVNIGSPPLPLDVFSSGSLFQPPLPSPLPPPPPTPDALSPGEVLVGKSIEYGSDTVNYPANPYDGTITVTLYAWAATYIDSVTGEETDPLDTMTGIYNNIAVQITDELFEFAFLSGYTYSITPDPAPADSLISINGTKVTWNIYDQSLLLEAEPLEVSYTITIDHTPGSPPPYTLNYWYSTGVAGAIFQPAVGNPYYYTLEETVTNAFDMTMNWNNGTGLNNGAIIDNELGITIVFPKNISPVNTTAYLSDGSMNYVPGVNNWNYWPQTAGTRSQAATVISSNGTTSYFSWQLQWTNTLGVFPDAPGTKSYYFTVKDINGPGSGVDVQYQVILGGAGGNAGIAGGKTTISDEYFQKTYNDDYNNDEDDLFYWQGARIVLPLNVMGQIMLFDPTLPSFNLDITKEYAPGDFHAGWQMDNNTWFTALIQDNASKAYLVFDVDTTTNTYAFNGMAAAGTPVLFSVNTTAVITGIPTEDSDHNLMSYTIAEIDTWTVLGGTSPNVLTTYSFDNGSTYSGSATINSPITPDDTYSLLVRNAINNNPSCVLRLLKLIGGFPGDWGISKSTVFNVKIWDDVNSNYLIFVSPSVASSAPVANRPTWAAGTYYCIGNDSVGGISDPYWSNRIAQDPFLALYTIPISELQSPLVGLSNIWPSTYEVQELDFSGNLLSSSPVNAWWQAYYNIQELTRMTTGAPGVLSPGGSYVATITNMFQHGEGNIWVFKELQGFPDEWGISDTTPFTIKILDMTDNSYLVFVQQPDGTYLYVGYEKPDGSRVDDTGFGLVDDPSAETEFDVSVTVPLEFVDVYTGGNHHYMVEEISPIASNVQFFAGNQNITGDGPSGGIVVSPDQNMNVTIVNYYLHQETGMLIIDKRLAGAWRQFASRNTMFPLKMTNERENRTLLFTLDTSNPLAPVYTFVGEVDELTGDIYELVWDTSSPPVPSLVTPPSSATDTSTWISDLAFSVNQPAIIGNLIPGNYIITEDYIPPPGCTFSYKISDPIPHVVVDNALSLTVTNTYRVPAITGGVDGGDGGSGRGGAGNNSGTGDARNIEGWTTSLLISALGMLCIMLWLRRQLSNTQNF